MIRKLLTPGAPVAETSTLLRQVSRQSTSLSQDQINARLRVKRSTAYLEAIGRLDAGGHTHNRQAVDALVAAITDEFPDITIDQQPLGIVSKCYLGAPYEVHTLDRAGNIIQHYKSFESLPPLLAKGRALAMHGRYAFVEVYLDKVIAVTSSGDTSIVKG
ncbi:hypothetical protein B0G80_8588 [Paraburkholderia sp. BL6669N2]|uniref:hypothetical protein n=1 Tax=Paraburkholderia sp. BL6669N2 TaxID=1938807 RepID=UPI000E362C6C|nr:hypothetical protein [Paraburkholderia sp. BL6669N2]REG52073.1 hypothetical protein B0G80_8588 [Paraburkholderia sp. BL6669N2]